MLSRKSAAEEQEFQGLLEEILGWAGANEELTDDEARVAGNYHDVHQKSKSEAMRIARNCCEMFAEVRELNAARGQSVEEADARLVTRLLASLVWWKGQRANQVKAALEGFRGKRDYTKNAEYWE